MPMNFCAPPKSIGIRANSSLRVGFHQIFKATERMVEHELRPAEIFILVMLRISVEPRKDPHDTLGRCLKNHCHHIICLPVWVRARSSTSVVEVVTVS
jgi:hypothetical protein